MLTAADFAWKQSENVILFFGRTLRQENKSKSITMFLTQDSFSNDFEDEDDFHINNSLMFWQACVSKSHQNLTQ